MASASQVSNKFLMLKWVYIVREEDKSDIKMDHFDVSQIYDDVNCYLNDFPSDLRLSEFDAHNFGVLIKLGYRLYFKCISGVMFTEDGRPYQAGFLCIRAPNTITVEVLEEHITSQGYTYRVLPYFPWPVDYLDYES